MTANDNPFTGPYLKATFTRVFKFFAAMYLLLGGTAVALMMLIVLNSADQSIAHKAMALPILLFCLWAEWKYAPRAFNYLKEYFFSPWK